MGDRPPRTGDATHRARVARHPGTRPQPARAAGFRPPVAVTSTRPKLSGAVLPGRHGRLVVTAAVAPSRVACRYGWQQAARPRYGRLPYAGPELLPRQYRATPGSMQITLIWTLHSTLGF